MARKINISKYQGNTVYSVSVTDSYGNDHHLGYWKHFDFLEDIEKRAEEIWANEVNPEVDQYLDGLGKAILNCKKIDKSNDNLRTIL
jgi:hypothetical protein